MKFVTAFIIFTIWIFAGQVFSFLLKEKNVIRILIGISFFCISIILKYLLNTTFLLNAASIALFGLSLGIIMDSEGVQKLINLISRISKSRTKS